MYPGNNEYRLKANNVMHLFYKYLIIKPRYFSW